MFVASNLFKLYATALLVFSSFLFSTTTTAANAHASALHDAAYAEQQGADSKQGQSAKKQTMALAGLLDSYRHAEKTDKALLLEQLLEQAKARQVLLSELVKSDPAAAVRAVLPASVRKGMPDQVLAMLAERQQLEGELQVTYEDYADESLSRLHYLLLTNNGRVALHLPENAQTNALHSGVKVRASGWLFPDAEQRIDSLALTDDQNGLLVLALDGSATTTNTTTTTLADTVGEQQTLVLLLNFQDNSSVQPWTVAQVEEMVFTTVSDYYLEASYGKTWLSGDVHGYLTLPIDATCDFGTMDSYAQQAARDSGIDVGSYKRLIYLFPKNSACGWRGQGTVGGTPSRAWINGELNLLTIGHEIGHNLGLHHAKYIGCNDGQISADCVSLEYGDSLDIMGKSTGHLNAFNKDRLGWLSAAAGEISTADGDGSYFIEPYESVHGGTAKGLKVRRGTDSITGQTLWYYLEYRQALGFDSFLAGKSITDGVLFHLNLGADINSSQLMDMTPNSSFYDLDDAALLAGSSYSDSDAGVTVTTEWADETGASVNVSYSGQSCIKASPSLSLSPNESAWVTSGTTVAYSATVTNKDSAECSNSDFSLAANVPAGWSASTNSLSLAPGGSGTVTINVTSAATASDGFYDIAMQAQNSGDSSYSSSAIVSYVIESPAAACVLANPQLLLSSSQSAAVSAGSSVTYTGSITNQNSDSCADADFDLSADVPTGWDVSSSSVRLASGNSAAVNVSVTSAADSSDGVYNFSINAQNSTDAGYSDSVLASYTLTTALPVCVPANPLISLSEPGGTVTAGATVSYSATVTNLDDAACAPASFSVNADIPAGWSASSSSINLAPGASTTVTLNVTSAGSAGDGVYNITITEQNIDDSSYTSSAAVSYEIASSVNSAPVAVIDNVLLPAKEATLINVLGNDWDPDGDNLSISAVSQGAKGSVEISSDGRLLYTPANSFKSSDSFSYTVSDGDKSATATVSVSLSSSSSGGGKGKSGK